MHDITLYQFSPAWGLPNVSPFCMKLEGYLKLGGLDYRVQVQNDPRKGPKGKVPYAKIDKHIMGDSEEIYEYLKSNNAIDLDSTLSADDRAIHHAMGVMCDESLYFALLYNRWMDDVNWPTLRDTLFAPIPKMVRKVVTHQIRKKVQADLVGQGMGRHNKAEVYSIATRDIESLGQYLADKPWFGGNEPVKLDVRAASYLANILYPPLENPLKTVIEKWPNLVEFTDRAVSEIYG